MIKKHTGHGVLKEMEDRAAQPEADSALSGGAETRGLALNKHNIIIML